MAISTLASASKNPTRRSKPSEEYAGYLVLETEGREVGAVKELFKSADDGLAYVEIKTGFLGLQSVLIPVGLVAVDDERQVLLLR